MLEGFEPINGQDMTAESRNGGWLSRLSRFMQGGNDGDKSKPQRVVYVDDNEKTSLAAHRRGPRNNRVSTTKYNVLTFIPKNLFEQFHRVAYIYFLILILINFVPQLAVFNKFIGAIPLIGVLIVSGFKDGIEDFRRYLGDVRENNRQCLVFRQGSFVPAKWHDIRLGDVVMVENDTGVPCDMVILTSSDPGRRAYVETMNLDGETNLKLRYALAVNSLLDGSHNNGADVTYTDSDVATWPAGLRVTCEQPTKNIYEFSGYLELENAGEGKLGIPIGPSNVLLRGCELRNTSWVHGVAVHIGRDCKALLNCTSARSKRSRVELVMDKIMIILSAILFFLCSSVAAGFAVFVTTHDVYSLPYFGATYEYYGPAGQTVLNFLSTVITLQVTISAHRGLRENHRSKLVQQKVVLFG